MQISSLGYLENKVVLSRKLSTPLKIHGLYSFRSSVPHSIHTHTCNQILYLSYPMNFISQTTLLECACGKN